MVAMGQSQMPPLSLWRWGFETKTHRQICTNTNVCNHFIPSSLCDHVGETFLRSFGAPVYCAPTSGRSACAARGEALFCGPRRH